MPVISNFPSGGGGGMGLQLGPVSNIIVKTSNEKVYVKWTDPEDIVLNDAALASWAGTLLVRKAGSIPTNRRDGTIVLDSKIRDQYKNAYFADSGLSNGTIYYYKFFPYTMTNTYTENEECEFTATPNAVLLGDVSGMSAVPAGNGKLAIQWTDPASTVSDDGLTLTTWANTTIVVKENSYATSPDDSAATYKFTSTTRNAYSASPLIVTSLENGTTYYISFFPTSTDGAVNTNAANRISGVANRLTIATVPSQSGSLTYNGSAQSPSWSGYDADKMTISVTAQTNAGTYQASFTPKDDYMWSDGNTTAKTANWTIGRASISSVPTQSGSLTYNGSAQSPNWTGYDTSKMTIGGTTSSTNAGTFTASFTPTGNYQWNDSSTTAKNANWTIGKAAGSLTLSASSVSLDTTTKSKIVTVTRAGTGTITATSSATGVATASVSGNTITITGQSTGSATITVKVAASTNYTAPANKTISVSVQFLPVKQSLNNTSWADIKTVSDADQGANYWAVGDRKAVAIKGTVGTKSINSTYYVYILGFDHNSVIEGKGITFGGFKTALSGGTDICLIDDNYGSSSTGGQKWFNMNHSSNTNSGGWKGCDLRYDVLGSTNVNNGDATSTCATSPVSGTLMAALPSELRAVMKPMNIYTDNTGGGSNTASYVTKSVDYLPLLAECEIFGPTYGYSGSGYANDAEKNYQQQYQYYKNGNSKMKYRHSSTGSTAYWWERSPVCYHSNYFCQVGTGGTATGNGARSSYGLAPAFRV